MPKKVVPKLVAVSDQSPASSIVQATDKKRVVKVNTANLSELKNAVDDILKEFFSLPAHGFTRSHQHEDVRLALGWSAVAIAAATGYYGYTTEFHESKGWVTVGVVIYVILNTILALYVATREKNTIFVGTRRTIASRISTERITLSSLAFSSPSHSTTSSWVPFPVSLLVASPKPSSLPSSATTSTPAAPQYPLYSLTLAYTHSSNANKSLLKAQTLERTVELGEWFDQEGRIARSKVEQWAKEALGEVVGTEGGKEE